MSVTFPVDVLARASSLPLVSLDAQGRLEPRAAWTVRKSDTSIALLLEELHHNHGVRYLPALEAAPELELDVFVSLPAELKALYDNFSELEFYGWRLRQLAELQFVELALHAEGGTVSVTRFVDLPDGRCLAFDWSGERVNVVLLRSDALTAPEPDDMMSTANRMRSAEDPRVVPVVANDLLSVLMRGVKNAGNTDFASIGDLFPSLPEWFRARPVPPPPASSRRKRRRGQD